jgi:glutamine amidotransferase-like uncharacterized protein
MRLLLFLFSIFFFFTNVWAAQDNKNLVLIYKGPGSCIDGCSEAAGDIPTSLGYEVKYVTPNDIKPEIFKNAILWIQPGGNAIDASITMGKTKLQMIRNFVWNGGAYVGFCAGAFLADKTVDDDGKIEGLGIIPVVSYYAPIDSNNDMGTMTWITWNGRPRHLFFNGGANFSVKKNDSRVKVIARFDIDGSPSTIQNRFGQGNVVVSGAHPEATTVWKTEGNLQDLDGSDIDLAQDMVRRALKSGKGKN